MEWSEFKSPRQFERANAEPKTTIPTNGRLKY